MKLDPRIEAAARAYADLKSGWGHSAVWECHTAQAEAILAAADAVDPLRQPGSTAAQAKAEALAPIRALHKPQTIHAVTGECASLKCNHDDIEDCPTLPLEVCAACVEVAENVSEYAMEDDVSPYAYPCATARAATIETEAPNV